MRHQSYRRGTLTFFNILHIKLKGMNSFAEINIVKNNLLM